MKHLTSIAICMLLLGVPALCSAQPKIEIIDFGTYKLKLGETEAAPDTGTGVLTSVWGEELVQNTRVVPASIGQEFGYRYKITGVDPGEEVTLTFLLNRPPMVDPKTGNISRFDQTERTKKGGELLYDGFGFEFDWELVPGEYVFEIRDGEQTLSKQAFTVVVE